MNRLILLGNGFDLAHGMKTSYNDFILWYLENCFKSALKEKYEDELIEILFDNNYHNYDVNGKVKIKSIKEYIDDRYEEGTLVNLFVGDALIPMVSYSTNRRYHKPTEPFSGQIKSELLKMMLQNCSSKRWVDIENLFYSVLKKTLEDKNQNKQEDVIELNNSLAYIISKLELYLSTLDCPDEIEDYNLLLKEQINMDDIIRKHEIRTSATPELPTRTLVLNFNYTPTIEQYISKNDKIEVNYIHGKLNDNANPIFFGFGDELDAEYAKFELDTTKGIFKYIKSFWYFKTSNYHNLLRFIQSDKFQIHILGHSCGLSDRTMLNMIFEHENCASIKIHYYGFPDGSGNNYTELTEEISRHFKNKQQMRLKIVPFDKSKPMPQIEQ